MIDPRDLIDVDRYPIDDLEGRGRPMVEAIRRSMADTVLCALPGFLRPAAIARMVAEAQALAPVAYPGPTEASLISSTTERLIWRSWRPTIRAGGRPRGGCSRSPMI